MDDKRQRILDAATQVFAEKGFEYATISEIAKEAGMSTGLIYSYFKNKMDVLLSLILIFLQTINELNSQRVAVLRNPFDKLYTFLHNCEDLLLKDDSSPVPGKGSARGAAAHYYAQRQGPHAETLRNHGCQQSPDRDN